MPKRVPKIRFKKYTDEWRENILSEFLEVSKEKNFLEEYDKTDVLSVSGDCGIVNQIEHKGRSFAGASVANYGVVDTGDVVYTKSPLLNTPYGIIKTNKGKPGIVSTLYAVYKPKENVDPNFIECYFEQNARINNYLKPLVNKGAKNDMKVTNDNALKGFVMFPEKEEQINISKYINSIDKIISKISNKHDKLHNIKITLLKKMFPKNGSFYPQIRFREYKQEWVKEEIKNIISNSYSGGTPSISNNNYYKNGTIPFIRSGDICKDDTELYITEDGLNSSSAKIVAKGTILYALYGATSGEVAISKINGAINQAILAIIPKKQYNPEFIVQWFICNKKNIINKYLQGGQGNLSAEIVKKICIDCPSSGNGKEQQKIGDFLTKIDKLLELYQKKIDHLRIIKQAFLQQMFA